MNKQINLGLAVVLATVTTLQLHAQTGGYTVTERGPDWKVMQKTTVENGVTNVHRYTELATGMNYTNATGQLVESKEEITILPAGGAMANQGRHTVAFPGDIGAGVLEVVTPDGKHLYSRPLGVTYDDGSNTVFIATLTNAVGYLTRSNQVTYRNCFLGIKADLVCTWRRSGFECDLVFREQPPTPGDYGLDEDWSTLQMVTEFFNTQDPQQIPGASDDWYGLQDSTLKFGRLAMTQGKAFAFNGSNTNSHLPSPNSQTPVYKRWVKFDGRKFLIEEVPVMDLAEDLNALPLMAKVSPQTPDTKSKTLFASGKRQFPLSPEISECTNQILLAKADFSREPGVVLDYTTIDSSQGGYSFQSGETYLINGPVVVGLDNEPVVFQGGAVIKFSPDADWGISLYDSYNVEYPSSGDTGLVIFTSKDDNSVGETIDESSGNPCILTNVVFLGGYFYEPPPSFLELRYAGLGLSGGDPTHVYNCQFHSCLKAVEAACGEIFLSNCLFSDCDAGVHLTDAGTPGSWACFTAINVTADNVGYLHNGQALESSWFFLTNCLFTRVAITPLQTTNGEGYWDACYELTSISNTYAVGPCGDYYLSSNSPYRDIGIGDVDSFPDMTTFAPQDGSTPDADTPDIGYHYPIIDAEDADHDDLPDWWEWYWFGNYAHVGGELDASGNTLLNDYQNYADGIVTNDPNIIQFAIEVENTSVVTGNLALHLDVTVGTPGYYAVLVDSTNFDNAVWPQYNSADTTASLSSQQGWHEIWVGLKGCAPEATVTWECLPLKLDSIAPIIVITSPSNNVVDVPMIHLSGYSLDDLDHISCDVSNTLGVLTNLAAGLTRRDYDTNILDFTTNYFECLDIPLTNGLNIVTVHASDTAGNVTATNFIFTLDYSAKTNPPAFEIIWPANEAEISGSDFNLQGLVSDSTVTISATITDTNGASTTISGQVERSGRFWVDALPLNDGTNMVSLTITDAVGNESLATLRVVKSPITCTMDPVTPESDLWKPKVNLTGTISDPDYAIWVNGVKGHNNGNGTWYANDVPTTVGGVAIFTIDGYAPDEEQPDHSFGN